MYPTPAKPFAQLADAAQALVGTRYQRQGRSVRGLDCVGLLVLSAQACGVDLSAHDYTTYGALPDPAELKARLAAALAPWAGPLEPGVVVVLDAPELGETHLGVVAEQAGVLTLVHAVSTRGAVIEHRLSSHQRAAIKQTYVLKD